VAFTGLQTVSEKALAPVIERVVPRGRATAARREKVARRLRAALQRWLRGRGFGQARVTLREDRPGGHTSFVLFRVRVSEGPRSKVGALDVTGVGPGDRLRALQRLSLRSGQFYRQKDVRESRQAVADLFADRGHARVQVTLRRQVHAGGRRLDLTFHVRPGPVLTVGAIRVRGASSTGERLVRRALLIEAGDRYHRSRIRSGVRRLRRTGAFSRVRWRERPMGAKQIAVIIDVTERPPE
jgi:outer membrane protein assembly factor BamA